MAERTESSTTVAASPAAVLAVIADLERYPEWTKAITAVAVVERTRTGEPEVARLTMSSGPIRDTLVVRYSWATATSGTGTVSWSLVEPGAVTTALDGSYELAAAGAATRVTYRLSVDARVSLPGLLRRRAERAVIDGALRDLKARVEG